MEQQPGDVLETLNAGEIHVDSEGDWFYQGNRINREDILQFFYDHLVAIEDGSYAVVWKNQRCPLRVDDTPFVIARVDRKSGNDESGEQFVLSLRHLPGIEVLDPSTLKVGGNNVLYAKVKSGQYVARFSRPAYYQLAEHIQEDTEAGQFYLEVNGERYRVDS